jgi:hypothetical protein
VDRAVAEEDEQPRHHRRDGDPEAGGLPSTMATIMLARLARWLGPPHPTTPTPLMLLLVAASMWSS